MRRHLTCDSRSCAFQGESKIMLIITFMFFPINILITIIIFGHHQHHQDHHRHRLPPHLPPPPPAPAAIWLSRGCPSDPPNPVFRNSCPCDWPPPRPQARRGRKWRSGKWPGLPACGSGCTRPFLPSHVSTQRARRLPEVCDGWMPTPSRNP